MGLRVCEGCSRTYQALTSEAALVPWNRDDSHNPRAWHPAWPRCSSLTYAQYARSSRLANRAPRSGAYASHHGSRGLARLRDGRRCLEQSVVRVEVVDV